MSTIWQDIRYGWRMLARSPGFTAVIVVVLAIGIGATTAMLSVVDAVTFRSCPYKDPDRLVCVYETQNPERTKYDFTSLAGFKDWREQNHVFESLVGANQWNGIVRTADRVEENRAFFVSEGFFTTLGAKAALGRTFLPEDYEVGAERVIVLSYDHWYHWFAGDPNAIGTTMTLNDEVFTVVGVLPEGFRWVFQGVACGLWMPLSLERIGDWRRNYRALLAIGRLKPGVSVEQTQGEMDLIADRIAQAYPETHADWGIKVVSIEEDYERHVASIGKPRSLVVLLGVVASVLLIACLHVASLLIARSTTREQEMAIRTAVGAHRLRLVRQLLTEGILLAALGGALGLLLAWWSIQILSVLRDQTIPWHMGISGGRSIPWFVDVRVGARFFLYATVVSLLTCGAFGVLPTLAASRTNLSKSLAAGRTRGSMPRFHGLRNVLVVLDIAMALMLLLGAGLMVNSYLHILSIDHRYNLRNVVTAEIAFDWDHSPEPAERLAVFTEAQRRVGNLWGVQAVSAAGYYSPVTGSYSTPSFQIEGHELAGEGVAVPLTEIFPDYFRTLEIPLLQGRHFTELDDKTNAPVMIVNEATARRFWPGESAIGKHITSVSHDDSQPTTYQVVGVAANIWHCRYGPDEPEFYVPYLQGGYPHGLALVVRTASDPRALVPVIHRELMSIAEDTLVSQPALLEDQMAGLFSSERFNMTFLSAFAGLAVLLAGIGVYGTTAYTVSRRTREIGIRMALGADARSVLKAILRQGLVLTAMGMAVGLMGALALTRVVSSFLYEVDATDPLTFICVTCVLAGVSLLASYLPARRAARIDPMEALRDE